MEKVVVLEKAAQMILGGNKERTKEIIQTEYSFRNLG